MSSSEDNDRLRRRLARERKARAEAEEVMERATRELYDRNQELVLLERASEVANSATSPGAAMHDTLRAVCAHLSWPIGLGWVTDEDGIHLAVAATYEHDAGSQPRVRAFASASSILRLRSGEGLPGRVHALGEPAVIRDVTEDGNFPRAPAATRAGLHAAIAFPVLLDGHVVAVLECFSETLDAPTDGLLRVLKRVGASLSRVFERAQVQEELTRQATHDPLTGLPNRLLFNTRAEASLLTTQPHECLAVAVIDLDGFKEVNDTLGHQYGDELLVAVANRLREPLRGCATAARLGGDEFALLLRGLEDPRGAISVLERAQASIRRPLRLGGVELQVESSAGVSIAPASGRDLPALLRQADIAMYEAKRHHLGAVVYTPRIDRHNTARLAMAAELGRAIEQRELVLHYQPKVDAASTHRLRGVEALVRWQHPKRGLIAPGEFIPLAERTSLIAPLSAEVLRQAVAQAVDWRAAGLIVPVAVNVAARCLLDPAFPGQVAALLSEACLAPELLEVEVTESSMMLNPSASASILSELSQTGIRVAIDDFGTGYSSLAQLKTLPVTHLKIDRGFVAAMLRDERDASIVGSTIGLAHDLGLQVVAEGVEDAATASALRSIGCDLIQGYWIARPQPAHELTEWIRERSPAAGDWPTAARTLCPID